MELKVKGKFVTSSKVKIFQNSQKYIFGYHDALKIYGSPKLCMYCKVTSFPPSEGEFSEKFGIFSKMKIFQNPSCYILEKINENYDNFFLAIMMH
jgi:hypothetical protein